MLLILNWTLENINGTFSRVLNDIGIRREYEPMLYLKGLKYKVKATCPVESKPFYSRLTLYMSLKDNLESIMVLLI